MKHLQHVVILGGSSGIGAELARQLASAGSKVLAVGRNTERLNDLAAENPDRIQVLEQDLCDINGADRLPLAGMGKRLGGMDTVIWAAGIMPKVALDEFDGVKDAETVFTNFNAAVVWLDEAATHFQQAGSGVIIGIGSVAGDRGRAGQPAYNASKAGLHAYLEALRNRLNRKGITVVTIKPGPVETPLLSGLDIKGKMPVADAARKIIAVSAKPGEHYLKITHRIAFAIIRLIPSPIFRRLNI